MTDLSPRAQAARAHQAETELAETRAAFAAVEAELMRQLLHCSPGNSEKILRLQATAWAVDNARQLVLRVAAQKDHAQAAIEAMAELGMSRP